MPFKHNAGFRHKFPKAKYAVKNWAAYNEYLRLRGDVLIWFDPVMLPGWRASGVRKRGGKLIYSDLAIELCLTLRVVFGLPLRQTHGFVRSVFRLMDLGLPIPDFSTLSRRGQSLDITDDIQLSDGPITLIVDSTGLQVHSGRAWMQQKHGIKKLRKTWRKLHIGFDPASRQIITSSLTTEHVDDEAALPDLCATGHLVNRFLGDGAYDGGPSEAVIRNAFDCDVEIVIPPPCDAIHGNSPMRNAHIEHIEKHGRIAWQRDTGYNERSGVEAQIGRYKSVIGSKLQSRNLETQQTETTIGVKSLNRMTRIGRAVYERVS